MHMYELNKTGLLSWVTPVTNWIYNTYFVSHKTMYNNVHVRTKSLRLACMQHGGLHDMATCERIQGRFETGPEAFVWYRSPDLLEPVVAPGSSTCGSNPEMLGTCCQPFCGSFQSFCDDRKVQLFLYRRPCVCRMYGRRPSCAHMHMYMDKVSLMYAHMHTLVHDKCIWIYTHDTQHGTSAPSS